MSKAENVVTSIISSIKRHGELLKKNAETLRDHNTAINSQTEAMDKILSAMDQQHARIARLEKLVGIEPEEVEEAPGADTPRKEPE